MFNIQTVVVPTDGSEFSYLAFEYAQNIAERYNAKIHLLYVLDKQPPYLAVKSLDSSGEKVSALIEEEANEELQKAYNNFKKSSGLIVIPVMRKGTDYEEIINYSREIGADLIIITTHGRTGLLHTLLGSVAEKVIRHSKIPVLVVSPPEI